MLEPGQGVTERDRIADVLINLSEETSSTPESEAAAWEEIRQLAFAVRAGLFEKPGPYMRLKPGDREPPPGWDLVENGGVAWARRRPQDEMSPERIQEVLDLIAFFDGVAGRPCSPVTDIDRKPSASFATVLSRCRLSRDALAQRRQLSDLDRALAASLSDALRLEFKPGAPGGRSGDR